MNAIQSAFRGIGLELIRSPELEMLRRESRKYRQISQDEFDLEFVLEFSDFFPAGTVRQMLGISRAQLRQDLFALAVLGFPHHGHFVEVGAADGVDLSNTYVLESHFGWNGIVAEPAHVWRESLSANRRCVIDTRAVWSASGEVVNFVETPAEVYSTIETMRSSDFNASKRKDGLVYPVSTVSLEDLVSSHGAPGVIDFLSMDTEGSEHEILSNFDFSKYRFKVLTIEHNFSNSRLLLKKLLEDNGYARVYSDLTKFDDWYVDCRIAEESPMSESLAQNMG